MKIVNIDWTKVIIHLMNVVIAYVLALPIAWDRDKEARSAGLRTFPLVAVASLRLYALSHQHSGK